MSKLKDYTESQERRASKEQITEALRNTDVQMSYTLSYISYELEEIVESSRYDEAYRVWEEHKQAVETYENEKNENDKQLDIMERRVNMFKSHLVDIDDRIEQIEINEDLLPISKDRKIKDLLVKIDETKTSILTCRKVYEKMSEEGNEIEQEVVDISAYTEYMKECGLATTYLPEPMSTQSLLEKALQSMDFPVDVEVTCSEQYVRVKSKPTIVFDALADLDKVIESIDYGSGYLDKNCLLTIDKMVYCDYIEKIDAISEDIYESIISKG